MPDSASLAHALSFASLGASALAAAIALAGPWSALAIVPFVLWLRPLTVRLARSVWHGEPGRSTVAEFNALIALQSRRRLLDQLRGRRRRPARLEDFDGWSLHLCAVGLRRR